MHRVRGQIGARDLKIHFVVFADVNIPYIFRGLRGNQISRRVSRVLPLIQLRQRFIPAPVRRPYLFSVEQYAERIAEEGLADRISIKLVIVFGIRIVYVSE